MAEDIKAALAVQRKKALLSKTPSWLDRDACILGKRTCNIDLAFHCQCNDTCKVQHTVYLGKKKLNAAAIAEKVAGKVQERHGRHNHTHEAPEPEPQQTAQHLRNTVTAQKRKLTQVEGDLKGADKKVAKAADAQKKVTQQKRQESDRVGLIRAGLRSTKHIKSLSALRT